MDADTYTDIAPEGRITGTVWPFTEEIAQRKYNTKQYNADEIYEGGAADKSHEILEKELVIGFRNSESIYGERGFSSLSGMVHSNPEQLKRMLYFIGVAGPKVDMNGRDQCFTVFKTGTDTVLNGPKEVYPGQLLCWDLPDPNGPRHRAYGTGAQKVLPDLVPFDHTNTRSQTRALKQAIFSTEPDFGVANLTIENLEESDMLAPIQEEALGIKYGEFLKMARVLNKVYNDGRGTEFLKDIGLFEGGNEEAKRTNMEKAVNALFGSVKRDETQSDDATEKAYYKYSHRAYDMAQDARNGAFMARTSTIIGRALSGAKPFKSVDVNFGDTKLAF